MNENHRPTFAERLALGRRTSGRFLFAGAAKVEVGTVLPSRRHCKNQGQESSKIERRSGDIIDTTVCVSRTCGSV